MFVVNYRYHASTSNGYRIRFQTGRGTLFVVALFLCATTPPPQIPTPKTRRCAPTSCT